MRVSLLVICILLSGCSSIQSEGDHRPPLPEAIISDDWFEEAWDTAEPTPEETSSAPQNSASAGQERPQSTESRNQTHTSPESNTTSEPNSTSQDASSNQTAPEPHPTTNGTDDDANVPSGPVEHPCPDDPHLAWSSIHYYMERGFYESIINDTLSLRYTTPYSGLDATFDTTRGYAWFENYGLSGRNIVEADGFNLTQLGESGNLQGYRSYYPDIPALAHGVIATYFIPGNTGLFKFFLETGAEPAHVECGVMGNFHTWNFTGQDDTWTLHWNPETEHILQYAVELSNEELLYRAVPNYAFKPLMGSKTLIPLTVQAETELTRDGEFEETRLTIKNVTTWTLWKEMSFVTMYKTDDPSAPRSSGQKYSYQNFTEHTWNDGTYFRMLDLNDDGFVGPGDQIVTRLHEDHTFSIHDDWALGFVFIQEQP